MAIFTSNPASADFDGINDAGFRQVDGGGGQGDVLRLLDDGMDLDLTTIANNRIGGIEIIDLQGAGANTLTLALGDILDISSLGNSLTLLGDASDVVVADFTGLGGSSASAGGFTTYTIGAGELVVDDDIDQTLIVL